MRRDVQSAGLAKILHPCQVVRQRGLFENRQGEGQVAFEQRPALRANLRHFKRGKVTRKTFEAGIDERHGIFYKPLAAK